LQLAIRNLHAAISPTHHRISRHLAIGIWQPLNKKGKFEEDAKCRLFGNGNGSVTHAAD